jgi:hypothetical protein
MSFKAVQGKIEAEGYSPKVAGAILAKKTREASPAAKKANPNLKKVLPAKKKPAAKPQPAWAGIANSMLNSPKC